MAAPCQPLDDDDEHHGAVLQIPSRQAALDPRLALEQPVEHVQHLVAGLLAQAQHRAEAGGGGAVDRPW